jgi:hypothetical protein
MHLKTITSDEAVIVMSHDELVFLRSAVNETLEAVPKFEFRARTGETREQALEIWRQLNGFFHKIEG